jgi:hypothetical protein
MSDFFDTYIFICQIRQPSVGSNLKPYLLTHPIGPQPRMGQNQLSMTELTCCGKTGKRGLLTVPVPRLVPAVPYLGVQSSSPVQPHTPSSCWLSVTGHLLREGLATCLQAPHPSSCCFSLSVSNDNDKDPAPGGPRPFLFTVNVRTEIHLVSQGGCKLFVCEDPLKRPFFQS